MSDMSDSQRKAARKVLGNYVELSVSIERDGEITRLIPWRRKSERGTPVELVNKVTPPSQIERDLFASCSALMEQV
jgi:hypothetical protein